MQVVDSDQQSNQNLLRACGALVRVVDLLESSFERTAAERILENVLRTLRVLVTGSQPARVTLKEEVRHEPTLWKLGALHPFLSFPALQTKTVPAHTFVSSLLSTPSCFISRVWFPPAPWLLVMFFPGMAP